MHTVSDSEPASMQKSQNVDTASDEAEKRVSVDSSLPPCPALDEIFSDRYTIRNQSYAKISEGFDPVICVYPFHSTPKHFSKHRRHNDSGRWVTHETSELKHEAQGDGQNWRGKHQRPSWNQQ